MKIAALIAVAGFACASAHASDEVLVLSPFEISSARATEKPPIVIKKRADFLLLEITLVNDTREPERRRDEVYSTLKAMVAQVPAAARIELFTEEFTLTAQNYQIPLAEAQDKRDTSRVTLYAKIPLADSDDVGALSATLRGYVRSIKGDGRTEVFTGDLGLSIKNPERYRYEVVQAIANDVKRLREMFGDGFEITVKGLDARLKWERASISEVELFLPFSYDVFPIKGGKIAVNEK